MYTFFVQAILRRRGNSLLLAESRTANSAQMYVCDSDTEAHVNMQYCITDGLDRETVNIQLFLSQVNSFVEVFQRSGEFERNQ